MAKTVRIQFLEPRRPGRLVRKARIIRTQKQDRRLWVEEVQEIRGRKFKIMVPNPQLGV